MNMHVKLLSSEAFSAQNAANIIQRRAPSGPAGGAYSAAPELQVGLRGHVLHHIHAVASQSTVEM